MSIQATIGKDKITEVFKPLYRKESLIALYLLYFILGMVSFSSGYIFYNEYRVIEVVLLLILGAIALFNRFSSISKAEWWSFVFIALGSIFWRNFLFLMTDLLLFYLLYKSFHFLNYNELITKVIVFLSFTVFLLLPIALWDYVRTGVYLPNWYPLSWNIRVYNSYFLMLSIFSVWFYITDKHSRGFYLLFSFLGFTAILLDSGRSATLAYTVFITVIVVFNRTVCKQLLATYTASWLTYIGITYLAMFNLASSSAVGLQIARVTTSLRYDLWMNAFNCWKQNPLIGCGFYQLGSYEYLAAHPHNLFIQVLSETGLIGFGILLYMMFIIAKHINWYQKHSYFIIAAFLAIGTELSLSGMYIYPITQIVLLWLLVFLLKNPQFSYTNSFNYDGKKTKSLNYILSWVIYIAVAIYFLYLFRHTTTFLIEAPVTPPRFWTYGYQLF
ncbi:O-antigen ligase family protein [Kordiimonas sp.]|uniref:O-antigen ligase family protein n=1 Tax=Kordiimonas sp. TaxID=1970157 RepID=UPI003A8E2DFC